ncbi:MAG: hypothetical protein U0360_07545 [Dehalococcoidia bacterium]
MIIDVHTHAFPPRMIERRGRLVRQDRGFAAIYGEASAAMVSADALLESMERAHVDVSGRVRVLGGATVDLAEEHAAYLLDAARASRRAPDPVRPVGGTGPALIDTLDRLTPRSARPRRGPPGSRGRSAARRRRAR